MSNVISMRSFKTIKECEKLFDGYEVKLSKMTKDEILTEFERYRVDACKYPHHMLTIVKGQILMKMMKRRPISNELRHFVEEEADRLSAHMSARVSSVD